jgi:hypothetical protein
MSRLAWGTLGLILLFSSLGHAEIRLMPREELIGQADYIGLVRVLEVRKVSRVPRPGVWGLGGLAKDATVEVKETVKGRSSSRLIIAFDTSISCPNVQYEVGETYVVFLERVDDNHYVTINHEQGREVVKNGKIQGWRVDDKVGTPVANVLAEIRKSLAGT